jgi:hypothetical protein
VSLVGIPCSFCSFLGVPFNDICRLLIKKKKIETKDVAHYPNKELGIEFEKYNNQFRP